MDGGGAVLETGSVLISAILIAAALIAAHFLRERIKVDKQNDEEPRPELWLRDLRKQDADYMDEIEDDSVIDMEEWGTNEEEDVKK